MSASVGGGRRWKTGRALGVARVSTPSKISAWK